MSAHIFKWGVKKEMGLSFGDFRIARPVFLAPALEPDEEYFRYNFNVEKKENGYSLVIGKLTYDEKEGAFEFSSVGLRYFEYREDGLEEWLTAWCKMKEVEFKYDKL